MSPVKTLRVDPATRFRTAQRALGARLRRRETLAELVREVFAAPDPAAVAEALARRVRSWTPLRAVVVFMSDGAGQLSMLTPLGAREAEVVPALVGVAGLVVQRRRPFFSASLHKDRRLPTMIDGTAVAFPLLVRNSPVGAVVAYDPRPSMRAPAIVPPLRALVRDTLGLFALALAQAQRLERAEALSVTDDLTGLYNSRYLREALHREAKRAIRYKRPLSVLFIDLDAFKSVNDNHGHLNGSRCLVEAASIVRSSGRDSDIVARYGGDEFVMVLPETEVRGATVVAKRVLRRMRDYEFLASESFSVRLTASVGIATLPDLAADEETLLKAADGAMYRVKNSGKNDFCLASRE